jgi:hypothetical protein
MAKTKEAKARETRQARVTKVVWGLLLITMGVLFTLHNLGKINMAAAAKFAAGRAVDGKTGTRWSSVFSDPQWITIDLGVPAEITRVKLNWQTAYATEYRIEVSDDDASWKTVLEVTDGDGGIDDHTVSAKGRYVRMSGTKRATPWGYSLLEFDVYGSLGSAQGLPATAARASDDPLSRGKPATSSSIEDWNWSPWFTYWPLLLVASGLPPLLAPKDGGDQVWGLVLSGSGVFLQLRNLEVTSWGFDEILPILLILGGVLLVIQSWRHMNGAEARPDGEAGDSASAP